MSRGTEGIQMVMRRGGRMLHIKGARRNVPKNARMIPPRAGSIFEGKRHGREGLNLTARSRGMS